MERIETYTDYRQFLSDFYEDRKKRLPIFSYRYFCIKAGLKSPALFKEVVNGTRNLTSQTIPAFIKGLCLTPVDAQYFIALVHFNQSKSVEEKTQYLEQLRSLKRKVPQETVPIDQYEFYSRWYYPVLRELACIVPWKNDFGLLAKMVCPPIKKSEARSGIKFLLDKGFLSLSNEGNYIQTKPALTTGAEVSSLGIRTFNETMARRGVEAINEFSTSVRDIRTLLVGISEKSYVLIKEEIREFISRVVRIVDDDSQSDRVYNIGIQMFPLSNPPEKEMPDEIQD
ncbi:MAG TPA: TIGR02147 family protein [Chitinispirillaceae bacterium]|nr:TIGR02147 family protein [Chitinispirillaceae bacterium]